jgi:tyrosyl-tRNA synthetase
MNSCWQDLKFRELVFQTSDENELKALLDSGRAIVYAGLDATAPSLQVGNLLILTLLKRLTDWGNKAIVVLGGATTLVGDPGGKSKERDLSEELSVLKNIENFKKQVGQFFEKFNCKVEIVNNYDWLADLKYLEFLRNFGKFVSVNDMLRREAIQSRLKEENTGISYAEFSYMLLQAFDYLKLYELYNCNVQCGGSEQWGNIIQGIEMISRLKSAKVYGFTAPLFLKEDGTKFGKTEDGAIWFDSELTSPYDFYQFWVRQSDVKAMDCIKKFTFITKDEIDELAKITKSNPEKREAQKALAFHMTEMIHGTIAAENARAAADRLYLDTPQDILSDEMLLKDVPHIELEVEELNKGISLVELSVAAGATASLSAGRRLIRQGGLYLNDQKILDEYYQVTRRDFIEGKLLVLRTGKAKKYLVILR